MSISLPLSFIPPSPTTVLLPPHNHQNPQPQPGLPSLLIQGSQYAPDN